jgi:hypothetical protein
MSESNDTGSPFTSSLSISKLRVYVDVYLKCSSIKEPPFISLSSYTRLTMALNAHIKSKGWIINAAK